MAGNIDTLQVNIKTSANDALKSIDYLISKLGDLRKILGPTTDSLEAINMQLREMHGHLKGIKSVGDPFGGFTSGAAKASRKAREFGEAVRKARREAEPLQKMEIVPINPAPMEAFTEKIEEAHKAFNRFKAEWEAFKAANMRSALGGSTGGPKMIEDSGLRDENIIDSTAYESLAHLRGGVLLDHIMQVEEAEPTYSRVINVLGTLSEAYMRLAGILGKVFVRALGKAGKALLSLAGAPFRLLGKAVSSAIGRLTKFMHSIARIAMYRAIRSALKAITQGFSEGIENLYLWSQAVGTNFAPTMDRLATSMLYLKNGFASMFSPLIEYFTPLIEQLVDKLVDAFNWVQRLFAQLTGKTQWYKAVKVQTVYKEATDDTAKSVKKLRQEIQLMDFDELNNITDNPDSGNTGKAAKEKNPDPVKMFELTPTGVDPFNEGSFWGNLKKWWSETDPIGWLWEKVSTWWNGIDFLEVGREAGKAVRETYEKFKKWFEEFDWKSLWEGIKGVFKDLGDFLEGFLRGLFPEWFEKLDQRKEIKEDISKEFHDRENALNDEYKGSDGHQGSGGSFDLSSTEGILSEIEDINSRIRVLTRGRSKLESDLEAVVSKLSPEDLKNFEWAYEQGPGSAAYDNFYTNYRDFRNYADLKMALDSNKRALDELIEKREKLGKIGLSVSKGEIKSIKSVSEALKSMGKGAEETFDSLSEVIPSDVAYITTSSLYSFTEADWANGGSSAMKKLDKALRDAGVPDDVRQIALKAAAKFGAERGWTTNGAKAADLIANSLHNADIPMEYQKVAKTALQGYLTYVDWESGGKATAGGIVNAFLEAGIPSEYAYVAGQAVYQFLNSVQWEVTGETSGKQLANGAFAGWKKQADERKLAPLQVKTELATTPGTIAYEQNKSTASVMKNYRLDPIGLKTKLPLSTQADILGMTNDYVSKVNNSGKMLNVKPGVFINATPGSLTESMNKRIVGIKAKNIELKGQITTTSTGLQKTINGIIQKVKPEQLVVPVKFDGRGRVIQVEQSNPYSGFTMENYAMGGFPTQGTMFVAGEMAGQAEMVGNINGRTGVASGQEITGIGDAVWSTGGTTARLISELIEVVRDKNLTISPSAALGRTVAKSQRLYAAQTG